MLLFCQLKCMFYVLCIYVIFTFRITIAAAPDSYKTKILVAGDINADNTKRFLVLIIPSSKLLLKFCSCGYHRADYI